MTLDLNSPDFLFHYTRRSTALEHILFDRELKIGPFRLTNDPREAKTWEFRVISQGRSPTEMFSPDRLYAISRKDSDPIIKRGVKVLCLTQNLEGKPGWGRPRMWAQYGDRHMGICLVLHKERLHGAVRNAAGEHAEIYNDVVRYSSLYDDQDILRAFDLNLNEIEAHGLEAVLEEQRRRFYHEFFLAKHNDWRDEAEYRWICFADDEEARFLNINNVLSAVIVSEYFPRVYESCLPSLCEPLGLRAGRVEWENGHARRVRWDIYTPT